MESIAEQISASNDVDADKLKINYYALNQRAAAGHGSASGAKPRLRSMVPRKV